MEYRDQLKYIKSHQTTGGERRPERNRGKKPAKPSFLSRVLLFVQAVSAVVLFGSMAILGILPMKYMAGLLVLLVLLLLVVKRKQKRSLRSRKKRSSGKGLAISVSAICLFLSFYCLKVNGALDKIAIGEESGKYEEAHARNVTEEPFHVYISGIDVYGDIKKEKPQ